MSAVRKRWLFSQPSLTQEDGAFGCIVCDVSPKSWYGLGACPACMLTGERCGTQREVAGRGLAWHAK